MTVQEIQDALADFLPPDIIKVNEPLKHYTHTRIGGNADVLVLPTSAEEVQRIVRFTRARNIPLTVLGNASNVIIRDTGIRGVVMNLTRMNRIVVSGTSVISQCGAGIIETSRAALAHQLTGLEFACGIPGSVGGAVYMNAGAYGGEVADVLQDVLVLTPEGEFLRLPKAELELAYRHSIIGEKGYTVLEAVFQLREGEPSRIRERMEELTHLREAKQPLEYPSCGSVFKRPPGHYAGQLIQESGLQGTRFGGAEVSTKHAGFIVNRGGATSNDYLSLIAHVQDVVRTNFGVELEMEVRVLD